MDASRFFRLIFITDRNRTADRPLNEVVRAALEGGVEAVQLREKDLPDEQYLELAEMVALLAEKHGARLIINGRPGMLARFPGAGLHVGAKHAPPEEIRREFGLDTAVIGYSAHSAQEALAAAERGADYVSFSPVFRTTKPDAFLPPTGIDALADLVGRSSAPVTALGGIDASNIHELERTGVRSVSVVSAISEAPDPREAAAGLLGAVKGWR